VLKYALKARWTDFESKLVKVVLMEEMLKTRELEGGSERSLEKK
jgi:hypothetical protein